MALPAKRLRPTWTSTSDLARRLWNQAGEWSFPSFDAAKMIFSPSRREYQSSYPKLTSSAPDGAQEERPCSDHSGTDSSITPYVDPSMEPQHCRRPTLG